MRRPTGRAVVHVGDPGAALALLDGRVAEPDGARLVVRDVPVADLTRRLVGAGIAVHEATAERDSLEALVLRVTGAGSDRVDRLDRVDRAHG